MSPKAIKVEANFIRYEEEEMIQEVERIVEVPIHTKREVPVIEEEIVIKEVQKEIVTYDDVIEEEVEERVTYRHVPVKEVVEVPKEVFSYIPEIQTKIIEQIVEVPGQIIERPVTTVEDREVIKTVYKDVFVPVSYDTKIHPCVHEDSTQEMEVELVTYVPKPIEVEVMQDKVVQPPLTYLGEEHHHVAPIDPNIISAAEYNSTLLALNAHLTDTEHYSKLPFREVNGQTPFMQEGTKMNGVVLAEETACYMTELNQEFADCVRCQHPSGQKPYEVAQEPVPEPIAEPIPEPIAAPIAEPIPQPRAEPLPTPLPQPVLEPRPLRSLPSEPLFEPRPMRSMPSTTVPITPWSAMSKTASSSTISTTDMNLPPHRMPSKPSVPTLDFSAGGRSSTRSSRMSTREILPRKPRGGRNVCCSVTRHSLDSVPASSDRSHSCIPCSRRQEMRAPQRV